MAPSIDQLKANAVLLQEHYQSLSSQITDTLQNKVLLAYSKRVCTQIQSIFNSDEANVIQQLELFLQSNWALVKGSSLCYTAIPHHDVTRFLCDIAYAIAEAKNQIRTAQDKPADVVKLLMPTVTTESVSNNYKSLGPYQQEDAGPWTDEPVDLINILQTHILSRDGFSLIPVQLLTEIDMNTDLQKIANPYFDYQIEGMKPFLTLEEYERLLEHSKLTRAIFETRKIYETYLTDKSNLLGHLRELTRALSFNSAAGIGSQTNAASGAYPAIIAFNTYYQTLGDEKNKIPSGVKDEIEKLLNFASNKEANKNATTNVQTCIYDRKNALEREMRPYESELSGIALQGENKQKLLEQAQAQFDLSKQNLLKSITENHYLDGKDTLGLTSPLLDALGIDFSFSTFQDLQTIQNLSPSEITELFKRSNIPQQFIQQVASIENLVVFTIETSHSRLRAIYPFIADRLFVLIHSYREISALLETLDGERRQIIYDVIKDHMPQFIGSAEEFSWCLKDLNPEQRHTTYENIRDKVLGFIHTPQDFWFVLHYLDVADGADAYEHVKQRLPQLIRTALDFYDVLEWLTPEKRIEIYESVKDRLPQLIQNADDFRFILTYLNPDQCTAIYESVKDCLPEMIQDSWDFSSVIRYLNPEQRTVVYESLKDRLSQFIQSLDGVKLLDGFILIVKYLNSEQRSEFYESVKQRLLQFIQSRYQLREVFPYLSSEQCKNLLESKKELLPQPLTEYDFFGLLLYVSTSEEVAVTYHALKDSFPEVAFLVFRILRPDQVTAIYDSVKDCLPQFILSLSDLVYFLPYLSSAQRIATLKALKGKLPDLIDSLESLKRVIWMRNSAECKMICEAVKNKLPTWITSTDLLEDFLYERSSLENRAAVCEVLLEFFPSFIHSVVDFNKIFRFLNEEQRMVVFEAMKDKISQFTGLEFIRVDLLTPKQRIELSEAVKENIPGRFSNDASFALFKLRHHSAMECKAICEEHKGPLLSYFLSTTDIRVFVDFLRQLPLENRGIIYQEITGSELKLELNDDRLREMERNQILITIRGSRYVRDRFVNETWFTKQEKLRLPRMKLQLALMNDDLDELKTAFDTLLKLANKHRSYFFRCGNTKSCEQLIDSLSNMQNKEQLIRLNDALELELDEDALDSPAAITKALHYYVKNYPKAAPVEEEAAGVAPGR